MAKRITISDLSRELGLSKTLVSMVMNGKGDKYNINKDTQKRVKEMAKKMNYRPNQSARSLRTGKSNTIGLIVPDISNPFFGRVARILEREFEAIGKRLLICSSDEDQEREKQLIDYLVAGNADGIVAATCLKDDKYYVDVDHDLPMVLFDRGFGKGDIPTVEVNNEKGAEEATKILRDSGKTNIWMLSLSPAHISPLADREKGFLNVIQDRERIIEVDHHAIEAEVNKKVEPVLDSEKPDAFFVGNNQVAIQLLKLLRKKNIRIPEEIAVLSYDDVELFELTQPSISGVKQPVDEIATRTAQLMRDGLDGKNIIGQHIYLDPTITRRESV